MVENGISIRVLSHENSLFSTDISDLIDGVGRRSHSRRGVVGDGANIDQQGSDARSSARGYDKGVIGAVDGSGRIAGNFNGRILSHIAADLIARCETMDRRRIGDARKAASSNNGIAGAVEVDARSVVN